MSVFRKYNKETKRWEPVASADATTIFTGNAAITPNGETTSIEDVLVRDRADIELLKKNVSWLAKHGGGGFGTGTASKATVQILSPLDNTTPVNNIIWKSSIQYVAAKIVSSYNGTYNVSVRVNGKEVYTFKDIRRNTIFNIPATTLGMSRNSVTLQVLAYDEAEMEYTAECKLTIASVELQKPQALTVTQNELQNANPIINLTYRTSIPGDYRMYFSDTTIYYDQSVGWRDSIGALDSASRSQYVDMFNVGTTVSNIGIDITDVYGDGSLSIINKNTTPGVYARYFVMVSATDPSISSQVQTAQINITLTDGILVAPQFGIDEKSPYSITLDGILDVKFIAYSSKMGTYKYTIYCGDKQISDEKTGNEYGAIITEKIPVSNFADKRDHYVLTIKVDGLGTTSYANMYILATEAPTTLLTAYKQDIDKYTIFDFTFWDNMQNLDKSGSCINNDFSYGTSNKTEPLVQNINIYNKGVDSGSTRVYYKMNHTCAGKIDSNNLRWFPENGSDTTSIIPGQAYQFTLSLAYYIGSEVDDNATVFYMGNYKPISLGGNGTGAGILITAHGYYIRIEGTTIEGVLSDNNFTQLDIVMAPGKGVQSSYTFIYIYQNGILLQASEVKINNEIGKSYSLYGFKDIYLACRSLENKGNYYSVENNINIDLYSIKFFRIPLNDGQIICNYINNQANYKRLITDSTLDSELITKLLSNNSIKSDEEVPKLSDGKYDTSKISSLYNLNSGEYDWGVTIEGNDIQLGNNLQNLPIPILCISGISWKYSEFTSTSSTVLPTTGKLRYKDGNIEIVRNVTIEPQGTTTLNYDVKNIDITFNDCLFSPKESWFPEQTFTCKADIVDSGHINNAMIGTFINDCLDDSSLINTTAFPIKNVVTQYQNSGNIPRAMNVKATIEGFPVLLVIDFASENGDGREEYPRVMGIYSFNLGRKSYYNQGFKVLKCLRDMNGNILNADTMSFPSIFQLPGGQDLDNSYDAYCFEGERSFNSSISELTLDSNTYDYVEITTDKSTGKKIWLPSATKNPQGYITYNDNLITDENHNPIAWNDSNIKKYAFNPDGYFWSNHDSYASDKLWRLVYGENTNEANEEFKKLNNCIATKLQYNKGTTARVYGVTTPQYEIVSNQGETVERRKTANTFKMDYPQTKEPVEISVKNTAFYYVVCMLFGLIDNFGKNLQMKYWRPKNGTQSQWSPMFYDMDTGLGIENTGGQNVPPTVFDESIINVPAATAEKSVFMYSTAPQSTNGIFTVYSNKLWGGLESPEFQRQYTTGYGNVEQYKVYSLMWSALRTSKLTSVDEFIDKYLNTQLNKCGEFLYNYDYNVKYLSTSQIDMLHGNRLSFIKNWLTERVAFLDSVFGCKADFDEGSYLTETANDLAPYIAPYNIPWKNQVNIFHHSGSYNIPIKTNKSLIVRTIIGNSSTSYVYAEKNKTAYIPMADSLNTQNIQTLINNSDSIIDINLKPVNVYGVVSQQGIPVTNTNNQIHYEGKSELKNIYFQRGSFSSLKKLDLGGCNISDSIDFFQLFKTWDSSPYGKMPESFQLQELNLSKVTNPNLNVDLSGEKSQDEQIPKIYHSPFANINSIDVSNSNISSIQIPAGVSLYNLKVNNSTIKSLSLVNQPLLASPNLNGCLNLEEVTYINCNRFDKVVFDDTLEAIAKINISDCENLEEISINGDGYKYLPSIAIQNCPKLKTITISKCKGDIHSNTQENERGVIKLSEVPSIETIVVNDSYYTKIVWDGSEQMTKLSKINLQNTKIGWVLTHADASNPENIIDLRGFDSDVLTNISFSGDKAFKTVYFSNIEDKPFVINTAAAFSNCSNLERVYGNVYINENRVFMACEKFTVHGNGNGNYNNITYRKVVPESLLEDIPYGQPTIEESVIDNGRWKHPSEMDILTPNGVQWQPGDMVTNMRLGYNGGSSKNRSNCFNGTACTIFDIYYILQNIDENIENITGLFQGLKSNIKFEWTMEYDNSPHRKTFSRCGNIININNTLSGSLDACRLYTPYTDEQGTFVPGVLTPLVSAGNMDNIFGGMGRVVTDRHIFDNEVEFNVYSLSGFSPSVFVDDVNSLEYLDFYNILNEPIINKDKHGNIDGLFMNCPRLGYSSLPSKDNGTIQNILDNVLYIDFDKIVNLGLSRNVTGLCNVLKPQYASGTLDIKKFFNTNEDGQYNLKNIYASFIVSNKDDMIDCVLEIDNDMFGGFVHLENISYNYLSLKNPAGDSFSGSGLTKKLKKNQFPYNLLSNLPELKYFIGFFKDCDFTIDNQEELELPGGMFLNNTKLEDISYCFYDIQLNIPVKLSQNSPFRNCYSLSNVKYLFGVSDNRLTQSVIRHGQLPAKFFYHGDKPLSKVVLTGTDYEEEISIDSIKTTTLGLTAVKNMSQEEKDGVVTTVTREYIGYDKTDDNNTIIVTPVTSITEVTTVTNNNVNPPKVTVSSRPIERDLNEYVKTYELEYITPNTSITDMEGCFAGADFIPYRMSWDTDNVLLPETNPEYQPYKYIYRNGMWIKAEQNTYRYTYMWVYDGVRADYFNYINNQKVQDEINRFYPKVDGYEYKMYLPDDAIDESYSDWNNMINDIQASVKKPGSVCGLSSTFVTESDSFCCAPDLLRYCSSNANITKLFKNCGLDVHVWSEAQRQDIFNKGNSDSERSYGLKGRLCPYLLKPLSNLGDLTETFSSCSFLGGYVKKINNVNHTFIIPESFLMYTKSPSLNLTMAFTSWIWPLQTDINVFNFKHNIILNVESAFEHPLFIYEDYTGYRPENDTITTDLSNTFINDKILVRGMKNCFSVSRSNNPKQYKTDQPVTFSNMFKVYDASVKNSDYYVFSGYDPMGSDITYNTRFGTKTLNTLVNRHNYTANGEW